MRYLQLQLFVSIFVVAIASASGQTPTVTPATAYLQKVSDQYHKTVDVYTDADAAGNHFTVQGEFDNTGAGYLVPPMDDISIYVPCYAGATCITANFDPTKATSGGWYFLNGILGPTDREPSPNWGTVPNAGYNLTGATDLQFWAMGANGGEQVEFFAFGVGNTQSPAAPYPDSSQKTSLGTITLLPYWTQYGLPLIGPPYVLGGFGWAATAANNPKPITFYLDNIQYTDKRTSDPHFPVSYQTLGPIYQNPFDTMERNAASVYDSSLALIALLAVRDATRPRTIADALLYAQTNDRFFTDNRLRNAYQGGDLMQPPGWIPNNKVGNCPTIDLGHPPSWLVNNEPCSSMRVPGWYDPTRTLWNEDEWMVGSSTKSIAWAMLALLDFYESTPLEVEYLQGAEHLGEWAIANTADTRGAGGFTAGYEGWETGAPAAGSVSCPSNVLVNGQCQRLYKSTGQNLELYAAFSRLSVDETNAIATCNTPNLTTGAACSCVGPDPTQPPVCEPRLNPSLPAAYWEEPAQNAKTFALGMWNADPQSGGYFWMGTQEDGVTVNQSVVPVDVQALAIQALGADAQTYMPALSWVQNNSSAPFGYSYSEYNPNTPLCNVDFAVDGYATAWYEGTGQVALAYLLAGNPQQWQSVLGLEYGVQASSGAMPAIDGDNYSCIDTGVTMNNGQPREYFHRNSVGATAWLSLAENGVNPFNSNLYSPQPQLSLSAPAFNFPNQDINSSSSPLSMTLTNSGNAPLNIASVSFSGDSEFAMQSGCSAGTILQPSNPLLGISAGFCTLTVVFSPTSAGLKNATIIVTDNALGSPQAVPVYGSGQDFSISAAAGSPTSQTVTAGTTASYTIDVSPIGGFNGTVALTCAVTPTNDATPTCTVSPSGIRLLGATATPVTLKVSTTGSSSLPGHFREGWRPRGFSVLSLPIWRLWLIGMLAIAALMAVRRRTGRVRSLGLITALILAGAISMLSCGGQATVTSKPTPTPSNTYTVTVSGANLNLTEEGTVTLVVQ